MRTAALAGVFLTELLAWAGIGRAVFLLVGGVPGAVAAGVAIAVTLLAWGLLAAPRARAPRSAALVTKVVVFGGAVVLLAAAGETVWAVVLAALVVIANAGVAATGGPHRPDPAGDA